MQRFAKTIATILVAAVAADAGMADERDSAATDTSEVIEQIIVTGSRIPRDEYVSPSPTVRVESVEIEKSGALLVSRFLNQLPQVDPAVGAGTGNNFGGETTLNLRALGASRTLVLLNGRRYPAQGMNNASNLAAIPPVLIDRIEIVTGGASAVYGSDAIAGAVNFLLRDDFEGVEANLQYGVTERGDGREYGMSAGFGSAFAASRGYLAVFADYFDRSVIFQDARSFSRTQIISDDTSGELVQFGSFASDAASIAGVGPFYTFEPDGTPRLYVEPDDRFSLSPYNPLQTPMTRKSAALFAHYDVGDHARVKLESSVVQSQPTQLVADEFFRFVDINVDRPDIAPEFQQLLTNSADPDGDGIGRVFLARTFSPERGTGTVDHSSEFQRALLRFESNDGQRSWHVDGSYANTVRDTRARNDLSFSRIQQGLLVDSATGSCFDPSDGCVPVNPFGAGNLSAAASEFIGLPGSGFSEDSNELHLTAGFGGAAFERPAGAIQYAAGAEYRHFDFRNTFPNDNLQSGDSLFFGNGVSPTRGSIIVRELYAEARLPTFANRNGGNGVDIHAGARVSDYSTFDDAVWTWKIGIDWQVAGALRLRAMRQRAVRAPGMAELFQGQNFAFTDFDFGPIHDQCSASRDPVGNGLAELCVAQGIPADQIGTFEAAPFPLAVSFASNRNLVPESADTFTAGVVWQSPRLSAAIDYFRIEIDDAIATADHVDMARLCFLSRNPQGQACQTLTRGPSGDFDAALITFINSAVATSEGVDLTVHANWPLQRSALRASLLASHYLEAGAQGTPLLPFLDCAGRFGGFCGLFAYQGAVPDWRATFGVAYERGPLGADLTWRYTGSMRNAENAARAIAGLPAANLAVPNVPSTNYFDLTFTWHFNDTYKVVTGIENLLDEAPPLLGSASREANTDPTTWDVLGRRYFVRLTIGY